MQAWILPTTGPVSDTLTLTSIPKPEPTTAQILVKVSKASINPADYKVPGMGFAGRAMATFPKAIGMDIVGTVEAVGSSTNNVKVGDLVLVRLDGTTAQGALSQYVVASYDEYAVLPKDTTHAAAAGVVTVGLTAYQTIHPYVKPGDKVFINGGSGGVGTLSIQIAKLLGCHVTVSCSTPKTQLCKDLGADEVIDYKTTDVLAALKNGGQRFALVVDNVGTSPPNLHVSAQDFLLPSGVFVLLSVDASPSGMWQASNALFRPAWLGGAKNKVVLYLTKNNHDELSQVADWLGQGKLQVIVDSEYPFGRAKEAYSRLKSGKATGKVIVDVLNA